MTRPRSPIASGVLLALLAAVTFGAATPFLQRFGREAGVFGAAALLYAGAAATSLVVQVRGEKEARVRTSDAPRLVLVAALGAFVAPVLLTWGLRRTSGTSASLMLNFEAGFTVVLGRLLYKEHLGGRVIAAAIVIAVGGALLILDRGNAGRAHAIGLAAVLGASFAWALDNAAAKPLAERDVGRVVLLKGALGATFSAILALVFGESFPPWWAALGVLACGAIGYGASLRCYLLAQRSLGAARTASVFAAAPFVGAGIATVLGEPAGAALGVGALLMALGVWLHATERHAHVHTHTLLSHDHAHAHDDGHHEHTHDPMPEGPHAHAHTHEPTTHEHPHAPDAHHEHEHQEHDHDNADHEHDH